MYQVYVRDSYALVGNLAFFTCETPFSGDLVAANAWIVADLITGFTQEIEISFLQDYGRDKLENFYIMFCING